MSTNCCQNVKHAQATLLLGSKPYLKGPPVCGIADISVIGSDIVQSENISFSPAGDGAGPLMPAAPTLSLPLPPPSGKAGAVPTEVEARGSSSDGGAPRGQRGERAEGRGIGGSGVSPAAWRQAAPQDGRQEELGVPSGSAYRARSGPGWARYGPYGNRPRPLVTTGGRHLLLEAMQPGYWI
jgi:hypothetical protein